VNPPASTNFSVNYVLECSTDNANWQYAVTSPTNALLLLLPSGYSFFRVRTDIVIK